MTLLERWSAFVNVDGPLIVPAIGPCAVWTGCTNKGGYGLFSVDGRSEGAHRVAWLIEHGRWPDPCALHRCDHRPCVRASHLFEGTKGDNNRDAGAKGRHRLVHAGTLNGRSKLDEAAALAIRERYAAGGIRQKDLAAAYGVSKAAVWYIIRGITWPQETRT